MNELEELTKKFILVDMDDAQISTQDKPIIGTQALATCTGLLLYCEEQKIAIVAHVTSNVEKAINKTLNLLESNNLKFTKIEYRIIPGYYENLEITNEIIRELKIGNIMKSLFNSFIPYKKSKVDENDIKIDEKTFSKQFAFNCEIGEFVTDKVLFGTYYYMINPENNINIGNNKKHI